MGSSWTRLEAETRALAMGDEAPDAVAEVRARLGDPAPSGEELAYARTLDLVETFVELAPAEQELLGRQRARAVGRLLARLERLPAASLDLLAPWLVEGWEHEPGSTLVRARDAERARAAERTQVFGVLPDTAGDLHVVGLEVELVPMDGPVQLVLSGAEPLPDLVAACGHARQAVSAWATRSCGLPLDGGFQLCVRIDGLPLHARIEGDSLGLPVALAIVVALADHRPGHLVAATGALEGEQVCSVGLLGRKQGSLEQLPLLLAPSQDDVTHPRSRPVSTLADAVEAMWGESSESPLLLGVRQRFGQAMSEQTRDAGSLGDALVQALDGCGVSAAVEEVPAEELAAASGGWQASVERAERGWLSLLDPWPGLFGLPPDDALVRLLEVVDARLHLVLRVGSADEGLDEALDLAARVEARDSDRLRVVVAVPRAGRLPSTWPARWVVGVGVVARPPGSAPVSGLPAVLHGRRARRLARFALAMAGTALVVSTAHAAYSLHQEEARRRAAEQAVAELAATDVCDPAEVEAALPGASAEIELTAWREHATRCVAAGEQEQHVHGLARAMLTEADAANEAGAELAATLAAQGRWSEVQGVLDRLRVEELPELRAAAAAAHWDVSGLSRVAPARGRLLDALGTPRRLPWEVDGFVTLDDGQALVVEGAAWHRLDARGAHLATWDGGKARLEAVDGAPGWFVANWDQGDDRFVGRLMRWVDDEPEVLGGPWTGGSVQGAARVEETVWLGFGKAGRTLRPLDLSTGVLGPAPSHVSPLSSLVRGLVTTGTGTLAIFSEWSAYDLRAIGPEGTLDARLRIGDGGGIARHGSNVVVARQRHLENRTAFPEPPHTGPEGLAFVTYDDGELRVERELSWPVGVVGQRISVPHVSSVDLDGEDGAEVVVGLHFRGRSGTWIVGEEELWLEGLAAIGTSEGRAWLVDVDGGLWLAEGAEGDWSAPEAVTVEALAASSAGAPEAVLDLAGGPVIDPLVDAAWQVDEPLLFSRTRPGAARLFARNGRDDHGGVLTLASDGGVVRVSMDLHVFRSEWASGLQILLGDGPGVLLGAQGGGGVLQRVVACKVPGGGGDGHRRQVRSGDRWHVRVVLEQGPEASLCQVQVADDQGRWEVVARGRGEGGSEERFELRFDPASYHDEPWLMGLELSELRVQGASLRGEVELADAPETAWARAAAGLRRGDTRAAVEHLAGLRHLSPESWADPAPGAQRALADLLRTHAAEVRPVLAQLAGPVGTAWALLRDARMLADKNTADFEGASARATEALASGRLPASLERALRHLRARASLELLEARAGGDLLLARNDLERLLELVEPDAAGLVWHGETVAMAHLALARVAALEGDGAGVVTSAGRACAASSAPELVMDRVVDLGVGDAAEVREVCRRATD